MARLCVRGLRSRHVFAHDRGLARIELGANELVFEALEKALHARSETEGLIHHSDRGSLSRSIRHSEYLAEIDIQASVGRTGDSYDDTLAESIIGLYKSEVIHRRDPRRGTDPVEYTTLEWVDWFNNGPLLEPIGDIPPVAFEQAYYRHQGASALAA